MPVSRSLKAIVNFDRLSHDAFRTKASSILLGMTNPAFPKPPVDLDKFKTAVDRYSALISEAMGGAKVARAARDSQRVVVSGMLRQLGHYVETTYPDDLANFMLSGFDHHPMFHVPPKKLPRPSIRGVIQGKTGELRVSPAALGRAAKTYEFCYAPVGSEGPFESWESVRAVAAQPATSISGLTPGVTYEIRGRAFNKTGYTDWSDPVRRMCI